MAISHSWRIFISKFPNIQFMPFIFLAKLLRKMLYLLCFFLPFVGFLISTVFSSTLLTFDLDSCQE